MDSQDILFRRLAYYMPIEDLDRLYRKAKVYKSHHQYDTLCNCYGFTIKELEEYRSNETFLQRSK